MFFCVFFFGVGGGNFLSVFFFFRKKILMVSVFAAFAFSCFFGLLMSLALWATTVLLGLKLERLPMDGVLPLLRP